MTRTSSSKQLANATSTDLSVIFKAFWATVLRKFTKWWILSQRKKKTNKNQHTLSQEITTLHICCDYSTHKTNTHRTTENREKNEQKNPFHVIEGSQHQHICVSWVYSFKLRPSPPKSRAQNQLVRKRECRKPERNKRVLKKETSSRHIKALQMASIWQELKRNFTVMTYFPCWEKTNKDTVCTCACPRNYCEESNSLFFIFWALTMHFNVTTPLQTIALYFTSSERLWINFCFIHPLNAA